MKKEVRDIYQGAIDTLHQKIFWKIQGFNLFMIVKRIVYFVLITLSLIFVSSITSQVLHLSSFQRESISLSINLFILIVIFIKMFKSIFRGSESDAILEFLKAIMNCFLWTLMFYLAFSINLTSYEKISNLILRWFVVAFLFRLYEIMVFKKLSKQVGSGKKTDYFDLIEQQVTKRFENERLSDVIVSEVYKLKYSRVTFKVNKRTIIGNRVINLGKGVKSE